MILEKAFSTAVRLGDGFVCSESPLDEILVLDYYDGLVEGLATTTRPGFIIYFKKVWWDEKQDNRVFDAHIVLESDLPTSQSEALASFRNELDRTPSKPAAETGKYDELIRCIAREASARVTILCRQITGPIFVLPLLNNL